MKGPVALGVSTIAFGSGDDLAPMLVDGLEYLELCGYSATSLPHLQRFASSFGGRLGVHCPLPFSGWATAFDITGAASDAHTDAMGLVELTLRTARQLGAAYIVVHFPTVTPDASVPTDRGIALALDAAVRLVSMGSEAGVRLFFENVGPNPFISSGRDFAKLFEEVERRSGIRPEMCLDPGHVHSRPGTDVDEFTRAVAPWVVSVHFYNVQRGSQGVGWHAPALPDQSPQNGWMDWPELFRILEPCAPVEQVILEHSTSPDITTIVGWARSLIY